MTSKEKNVTHTSKPPVAVLTGASRGIGAHIARTLAERGYAIGASGHEAGGLAALRAAIVALGSAVEVAETDVRDFAAVSRAMERFNSRLGGIDLLINCAGIAYFGGVEQCTSQEWQDTFDINVGGYFNTTKAALAHLKQSARGQVINMSSVWAHDGSATMAAYAASKHAVEGLTSSLRKELGGAGIKVSSLVLDKVDTDFRENMANHVVFSEAQRQLMLSTQDVADAVLYMTQTSRQCLPSTITLNAWRWQ